MKVIQGLYSGVTTVELDTLAAEITATLTTKHPDYAILAARIAVSNLHKETKKVFSGELRCMTRFISMWHFTIYNELMPLICLLASNHRCYGGPLQLCESPEQPPLTYDFKRNP